MKQLVRVGTYATTAAVCLVLGFWLSGMLPYQGGGAVVGSMFGGFIGFILFGMVTPASDARQFRLLSLALCMFFLGVTAQGFYLIGHH